MVPPTIRVVHQLAAEYSLTSDSVGGEAISGTLYKRAEG